MEENAIEVRNLRKSFLVKQKPEGFWAGVKSIVLPQFKEIVAVDKVSLSAKRGELLAFIGPNGAGKSTTIKMLIGILYPSGGEINVLGFDPSKDRQKLAFQVGSVFGQRPQLWYHLPPKDTFNLLAKIYELDGSEYKKTLSSLIEAFEIQKLLKTPVRKLSLGQRMRCEIVASLLHKPKILFLDEPTIGLDVIAKKQIREVIKRLNKEDGVTVFLTSHDAGDVETLAQRTVVINNGGVIFDDKTEELKKRFIKSKTVEIITEEPVSKFSFMGGKIIEKGKFNLKIEVDTTKTAIGKLLSYAVDNFDIRDINIFDPSMEEIITAIYREGKHEENN